MVYQIELTIVYGYLQILYRQTIQCENTFLKIYSVFGLERGISVIIARPQLEYTRFPRAVKNVLQFFIANEPRANRMLVMKALRQDVAFLAFHPLMALRGLIEAFPPANVFGGASIYAQSQESRIFQLLRLFI